jgi:hypothetical protein
VPSLPLFLVYFSALVCDLHKVGFLSPPQLDSEFVNCWPRQQSAVQQLQLAGGTHGCFAKLA